MNLSDKGCLITGASRGVGLGVAQGFAQRGARVAAGCRSEKDAARLRDAGLFPVVLDVTDAQQVIAAVEMVERRLGPIDVLINNAGIYPRLPAEAMNEAEWLRIVNVNLHGAWRCCEAVMPGMIGRKSGVIINVGSVTYQLGMANLVHYISSKGGLVGMTRGMARDLGQYGIRVNLIHLGAVKVETELELGFDQEELAKELNEKQSMPGRLTPESVEPTFAFFASDASSDVTGQCLTVDRGWTHG